MEIKKISERVELNVAGQGCWNDCTTTKWQYSNKATKDAMGSISPCVKTTSTNYKKCFFW